MKYFKCVIIFLFTAVILSAQDTLITTSDGIQLFVRVKGKGTPCLYIHGGPGSGSHWLEKFSGDSLEQHFRMIYLDQRGVARSSGTTESNYSADRMADDFEEVRKALGINQWLTMGHSFGGILQMAYIIKYPESISGMIMINCALSLKHSYESSWAPKALEFSGVKDTAWFFEKRIPFTQRWDSLISVVNKAGVMWKMGYEIKENMDIMSASFGEIPVWNWAFGSQALSYDDYWKEYFQDTEYVKAPVLFFYGEKDWMVGPEHYKNMKFPVCMLRNSSGGHMPFMENTEDLYKALKEFREKYGF